jgi:succinyl-CoA synthetase beta subunit
MEIHEYQAKALLRAFGVPLLAGRAIASPEEAEIAALEIGGSAILVKSQIHAGARASGHFADAGADAGLEKETGIRFARSAEEAREFARRMLGRILVTDQTGPEGQHVNRLYLEPAADIESELFLSAFVDGATGRVTFVAAPRGGSDIESIAREHPDDIHRIGVDPATGILPHHGRVLARALGLAGDLARQAADLLARLYAAFIDKDMALLEINPLVVTKERKLLCLDAKISFDPNALYRHPDIVELRDPTDVDAREIEAARYGLDYIALDGRIGCMVNGAGLAMATLDMIRLYGEEPANFLDVGGANEERVTAGFGLITSDPRVKGILVNIFGGIMRCDVIARGVVAAARSLDLQLPLVVRLEGTNVDLGMDILTRSGLNVIPADDLDDAARKIVAAINTAH